MTHSRNKPNQQIMDEAAEWFVEFREGNLGVAAQRDFSQWLRRSPEHISAYMEVAVFWADVPNIVEKDDIDVSALIAYAQGEDNVVPLGLADRRENTEFVNAPARINRASPTIGPSPRARVFLAACAAFGALGLGLVLWGATHHGIYHTGIGEQRSVMLRDGSTVELNAKSRLRVHFTEATRDIELLEGEALFRVARDPRRPFVVSSGEASVRAVGTQFDVYRKKVGTLVTVIEGKVAVEGVPVPASNSSLKQNSPRGKDPVLLSAGEQLVVDVKKSLPKKLADISSATAWTQRLLVFQGAPLGEVVEEFNRYNKRQMEVMDEGLQGVRISGVFSSSKSASLVRFLREQVHLEVTESSDSVRISRR